MSTIQELQTRFDMFPTEVKQAKQKGHYTNQTLADLSGVSKSHIDKFFSGCIAEPRLYSTAAICKAMNLSLDALLGISIPEPTPNIDTETQLKILSMEKDIESDRLMIKAQERIIKARTQFISILSVLTLMFGLCLIYYLRTDYLNVSQAGVHTTLFCILIITLLLVIVSSLFLAIHVIWEYFKGGKNGKKD